MRQLPALLLFAACAIPVEDLPDEMAVAVCDKAAECDDLSGSHANCVSLWTGLGQTWVNLAEAANYEYDPAGARACVASIRRLRCDQRDAWDFETSCGDVWR
jgi:hypothetical protein